MIYGWMRVYRRLKLKKNSRDAMEECLLAVKLQISVHPTSWICCQTSPSSRVGCHSSEKWHHHKLERDHCIGNSHFHKSMLVQMPTKNCVKNCQKPLGGVTELKTCLKLAGGFFTEHYSWVQNDRLLHAVVTFIFGLPLFTSGAVAGTHDLPYLDIAYYPMSMFWSESKYSV